MDRDRLLARVSALQLLLGVAGNVVALRRRRAYDVPLLHGRPDRVGRDSVVMGTALSAPIVMLSAQAVATTRLLRGPDQPSRRVLGGLGAVMVAGYLAERLVRHRLTRSGYDPVESTIVVTGIALAGAMAGLGLTD